MFIEEYGFSYFVFDVFKENIETLLKTKNQSEFFNFLKGINSYPSNSQNYVIYSYKIEKDGALFVSGQVYTNEFKDGFFYRISYKNVILTSLFKGHKSDNIVSNSETHLKTFIYLIRNAIRVYEEAIGIDLDAIENFDAGS